ncbi:hypothetical protein HYT56_01000 [Candidatus Woesearchaeota archaeon]|nr:hypothetical protein [Candidatus Woesearchaeota archaeon]
MSWRKNIDPILKEHLEKQIRESYVHKNSYSLAKNKNTAQLWVAIANLSKQIFELNLRIKFLEKTLKENTRKKNKKEIDDDVKKVLDAMQKF